MYVESRRYIDGVEVQVGSRLTVHSNLSRQPISIVAVCEGVSPDCWRANLSLFGQTIITTETFDDPYKAASAAEAALTSKLVELLRD